MINSLSIDLESWVHRDYDTNFSSSFRKELDGGFFQTSTELLLNLLEHYNVKATFFIVSETYDWSPETIEAIYDANHNIGFHSHSHKLLTSLNDVRTELWKGRDFIKKWSPKGFRAPMVHLPCNSFLELKKYSFKYDSSIYGTFKEIKQNHGIVEIPISSYRWRNHSKINFSFPRQLTLNLLLTDIPFGSGFFLGLLGHRIIPFIRKINKMGVPALIDVHPWQLFHCPIPSKLKILSSPKDLKMIPYYQNRLRAFHSLLSVFRFSTIESVFEHLF